MATQQMSVAAKAAGPSIAEVTPALFIGSVAAAKNHELLTALGITHICSCIGGEELFSEEFKYLILDFTDRPSTNLADPIASLDAFLGRSDFTPKSKLLIYCGSGMSRSPSMAVAHLMRRDRLLYEDAMTLVKVARGRYLQINHGFAQQLKLLVS